MKNNEFIARTFEWTTSPEDKRARAWSITETKSRNHFQRETFLCLEIKDTRGPKGAATEINQNDERESGDSLWSLECHQ